MLATSDVTVKLVAPAVGSSFIGRGIVLSATRSTILSRADVHVADGELIATGLVSKRALSRP